MVMAYIIADRCQTLILDVLEMPVKASPLGSYLVRVQEIT